MPITKSARKKMRQDKKREVTNELIRTDVKRALRTARKNMTATHIQTAYHALDTAAKKRVIHKNKAARLKSRLAIKSKQRKAKTSQK